MLSASSGLLLIGCGQMGGALLQGWYQQRDHLCAEAWTDTIHVVESQAARREQISQRYGLVPAASVEALSLSSAPALVVLAVKPQQLDSTLRQLLPMLHGAPVLSIAAGKKLHYYENLLPHATPIIRAMPNMASIVGLGITYCLGNAHVSKATRSLADQLFSAVGSCHWLEQEEAFHAVTAFAGSGPAFVFYFMDCLERAARSLGVDERALRPTLIQLMQGSLSMVGTGADLTVLRQSVTSPGGVTEAGLRTLMDDVSGLAPLLALTLERSAQRSKEMAD